MRFLRFSLAAAIAVAGMALLPAVAASASTFSCTNNYLVYCQETDTPGSGNTVQAAGLPSQVDTGQGTYCMTPYYSSTGNVVFYAAGRTEFGGAPLELRWRVWFSTSSDMSNASKVWKDTATDESNVAVPGGAPGWFQGCTVNYDQGAPNASFAMQVEQG
jgi:hypothetical protein